MLNNEVVSIIFNLINFCVLIGIFIYYYRKKLSPQMAKRITEKKLFWSNLEQNCESLIHKVYSIKQERMRQQDHGTQLLEKMHQWRVHVNQATLETKLLQDTYKKAAQEKRREQMYYLNEVHMYQLLLPDVFDQAQRELKEYFIVLRQKEFLQASIAQFEKGI